MKKLLEFKVFDLLQNKDNEKFLDKVKKENPNLYSKFVNILGNKGLKIAKQKYEEFDPENVKKLKELEKEEVAIRKKQRTKEGKEELKNQVLEECASEIEEIERILYNSVLYDIQLKFKEDKNVSSIFKNRFLKKKYKSEFSKYIKNPKAMRTRIKNDLSLELDSLIYLMSYFDDINNNLSRLILIRQFYYAKTKNLTYSLSFNFNSSEFDFEEVCTYLKSDSERETNFLNYRSNYINSLGAFQVNKPEMLRIIDNFCNAFSDNFYEEWKLKIDIEKYNL